MSPQTLTVVLLRSISQGAVSVSDFSGRRRLSPTVLTAALRFARRLPRTGLAEHWGNSMRGGAYHHHHVARVVREQPLQ